jgi:hypothetical protein
MAIQNVERFNPKIIENCRKLSKIILIYSLGILDDF